MDINPTKFQDDTIEFFFAPKSAFSAILDFGMDRNGQNGYKSCQGHTRNISGPLGAWYDTF